MKFAIVDVETTGPNPARDKIIDIAIYIHDGEQVIDSFSSLINPECNIPPFIARLTGISNEMVSTAPKFFEVAKDIVQITDGAVFVAHNASFDYSFIRQEFKSLGFNFSKSYLCTIRLSRKLLPGYTAYGLGKLCTNLGIKITDRHRAAGDAQATVKLLDILLEKNKVENIFPEFLQNDFLNFRFPPGFDKRIIDTLPDDCGVYYFYNDKGKIIYIGKSKNIRTRVLSHFSNKQSRKAIELRNSINDITFELTGNELIALLHESNEIKKHQPVFNRAQRRTVSAYGIYAYTSKDGYLNLAVQKETDELPLITVSAHNQGVQIINKLIDKFALCQKYCDQDIKGTCFNYAVRLCRGACAGKESPDDYNTRVLKAVKSLTLKHQNFMIIGSGRSADEKSVIHVEKGKYLGYGYFSPDFTPVQPHALLDVIVNHPDNADVQRMIRTSIRKIPSSNLITY